MLTLAIANAALCANVSEEGIRIGTSVDENMAEQGYPAVSASAVETHEDGTWHVLLTGEDASTVSTVLSALEKLSWKTMTELDGMIADR